VADEGGARRSVPQGNVIGRVPRRVHDEQRVAADGDRLAVAQRVPVDLPRVLAGPRELLEPAVRMLPRDGGRTGRMIAVRVGDDDPREVGAAIVERRAKIREMLRLADARIDQGRVAALAGEQIRVVAAPGQRTGVVGVENDGDHAIKSYTEGLHQGGNSSGTVPEN